MRKTWGDWGEMAAAYAQRGLQHFFLWGIRGENLQICGEFLPIFWGEGGFLRRKLGKS